MYLYRHTPSGQSRVYRVTQLRADGVHCRESAGTGPVVLKVVAVTGAAFASPLYQSMCASIFSHPVLEADNCRSDRNRCGRMVDEMRCVRGEMIVQGKIRELRGRGKRDELGRRRTS